MMNECESIVGNALPYIGLLGSLLSHYRRDQFTLPWLFLLEGQTAAVLVRTTTTTTILSKKRKQQKKKNPSSLLNNLI